jgi:hypothetical protein
MNYHKLAFTDAVKKMQETQGSRSGYSHMENRSSVDGLTEDEIAFISERDSFYMASYGANDFPYIQHRGGPLGFIKVIDNKTLGIVDFAGNKQYISVGNVAQHNKVALILVSYPDKARLKIYAEIEIVELAANPELYETIKPLDYKFRPERMMIFNIKAFDWNCPQHITPRFTAEEIDKALAPQKKYLEELEKQIQELKNKLANK